MPTTFTNLKNNCATVLNASIDGAVTSVVAVAGGGAIFPTAPFYLSCEYEVMKCTGISGDVLTVTRGADGTTAAAHTAGAVLEQRNNAGMWTDISAAVTNIENGTTNIPFSPPDGSIPSVKLGPDVYRPNLLQNGNFEIWANTAPGASEIPFASPWYASKTGAATFNIARETVDFDSASYACRIAVAGAIDDSNCAFVIQNIGQNDLQLNQQLRGKTVTLTARVKTSVANNVRMVSTADNGAVFSSYHTGSGAYETLTLTRSFTSNNVSSSISINITKSSTAWIDSVSMVLGTVSSPAQPAIAIPDMIPANRLAPDAYRTNYLNNGGFEIWQRTAGPFAANGAYTADGWKISITAGSTCNVSQTSGNNSPFGMGVSYSKGSGTFLQLYQPIEFSVLKGKYVTFSLDVMCSAANALQILVYDGVGPLIYSAPHPGGNVWQRLSCQSYVSHASAGTAVYIENHLDCTAVYDNATLCISDVPVNYTPVHQTEDYNRAMRFYEQSGTMPMVSGIATAASQGIYVGLPYKSLKGGNPTVTLYAFSNINAGNAALNTSDTHGIRCGVASLAAGTFYSGYAYNSEWNAS